MKTKVIPDEDLVQKYKELISYSDVATHFGISKQAVHRRINRLRSLGWDLPEPRCQVIDCNGFHYAKNMCRKHYARYQRYGHPLARWGYIKPASDWRKGA